jgi:hypothetical protein
VTSPAIWTQQDILSVDEVAERLKVTPATVYRLGAPHFHVGRTSRYEWGPTLEWLRSREAATSAPRSKTRSTSAGRGEVFGMPHRAGYSRDAEGRDRATMGQVGGGSGRRPESHV